MKFFQHESVAAEDELETAETTKTAIAERTETTETKEATEAEKIQELKEIIENKKKEKGYTAVKEILDPYVKLLDSAFGRDALIKTKVFHLLIDSGFNDELSPEFDLPGGRIERFIRERL